MRAADAARLGLLHGPAELLPVSSSAHVALAHRAGDRSAEIALHAGSAAALTIGLRSEVREVLARMDARRAAMHLLAGAVPAAVGWRLRERIARRRSPVPGLLAGSVALALADRVQGTRTLWDAGPGDGLALGCAQACALVPGVSRNGATLAAARALGFARRDANRLSREVGLPVTLGAVAVGGRGGPPAGLVASFAATLAALPLLRVVDRSPLWPWAAYRCVLALVLLERIPSMTEPRTTYSDAGVDYGTLDAGKRSALTSALATSALALARGARLDDDSRGEPAVVFDFAGRTMAMVLEGLGTKSVIARQVEEELGLQRFGAVAVDTVAAIVNDLGCVGALPLVLNAYFSTGSSAWYEAPGRSDALIDGWRRACEQAGCAWGGGESPTLPGLVAEADIELAGCAVGALPEGRAAILGQALAPGDEIVFVASSGMHANGASMARLLAGREPAGYATELPDGRPLGEALLDPSLLYVSLIESLWAHDVPVTYLSHVTGHGFLKLMRPRRALGYRITAVPEVPPVLSWMADRAGMDHKTAYSTFNMGVGYAVYCAAGSGARVVELAQGLGHRAHLAGAVEDGPRRVVVEPLGVTYEGDEMDLGPTS